MEGTIGNSQIAAPRIEDIETGDLRPSSPPRQEGAANSLIGGASHTEDQGLSSQAKKVAMGVTMIVAAGGLAYMASRVPEQGSEVTNGSGNDEMATAIQTVGNAVGNAINLVAPAAVYMLNDSPDTTVPAPAFGRQLQVNPDCRVACEAQAASAEQNKLEAFYNGTEFQRDSTPQPLKDALFPSQGRGTFFASVDIPNNQVNVTRTFGADTENYSNVINNEQRAVLLEHMRQNSDEPLPVAPDCVDHLQGGARNVTENEAIAAPQVCESTNGPRETENTHVYHENDSGQPEIEGTALFAGGLGVGCVGGALVGCHVARQNQERPDTDRTRTTNLTPDSDQVENPVPVPVTAAAPAPATATTPIVPYRSTTPVRQNSRRKPPPLPQATATHSPRSRTSEQATPAGSKTPNRPSPTLPPDQRMLGNKIRLSTRRSLTFTRTETEACPQERQLSPKAQATASRQKRHNLISPERTQTQTIHSSSNHAGGQPKKNTPPPFNTPTPRTSNQKTRQSSMVANRSYTERGTQSTSANSSRIPPPSLDTLNPSRTTSPYRLTKLHPQPQPEPESGY